MSWKWPKFYSWEQKVPMPWRFLRDSWHLVNPERGKRKRRNRGVDGERERGWIVRERQGMDSEGERGGWIVREKGRGGEWGREVESKGEREGEEGRGKEGVGRERYSGEWCIKILETSQYLHTCLFAKTSRVEFFSSSSYSPHKHSSSHALKQTI